MSNKRDLQTLVDTVDVQIDTRLIERASHLQREGRAAGLSDLTVASLILAERLESILEVQFHNLAHKLTP